MGTPMRRAGLQTPGWANAACINKKRLKGVLFSPRNVSKKERISYIALPHLGFRKKSKEFSDTSRTPKRLLTCKRMHWNIVFYDYLEFAPDGRGELTEGTLNARWRRIEQRTRRAEQSTLILLGVVFVTVVARRRPSNNADCGGDNNKVPKFEWRFKSHLPVCIHTGDSSELIKPRRRHRRCADPIPSLLRRRRIFLFTTPS